MFGHWIKNHKFTFALASAGALKALADNWWTLTSVSFMGDNPGDADNFKKVTYLCMQIGLAIAYSGTQGYFADLALAQLKVLNMQLNDITEPLNTNKRDGNTTGPREGYQSLEMSKR